MNTHVSSSCYDWIWEDFVINNAPDDTPIRSTKLNGSLSTNRIEDAHSTCARSTSFIDLTEEENGEEYWTEDKDDMLMKLAVRFEFQWSKLSVFFDGKSTISLRKRWNIVKRAKLSGLRLYDSRHAFKQYVRPTADGYKSVSNVSHRKDTAGYLSSKLVNLKENQCVSFSLPYRYNGDINSLSTSYQCIEEDSTSTATSEDCSSSDIRSPFSPKSELTVYSVSHLSVEQKRKILRQLYNKVDELEGILRDTNSSLVKIAQTIEDRKKTKLKV